MSKNIFKKKAYLEKNVDEFTFKWYYNEKKPKECYLEIGTTSGVWGMSVSGNTYTYGYLLAAAQQNLDEQLSGYAAYNYLVASEITQDKGLVDDLTRILNKWWKRMYKAAQEVAKNVSEAEEQAAQAMFDDIISEQGMSKKELAKKREEDKEIMREILNEKGENDD